MSPQKLQAQRVLVGRREDVEDAAAHGELPAALHHVDARVRGRDEPVGDIVQVDAVAHAERNGLKVAEAGHHGLEQRTHGHHEHADGAGVQRVIGVGEAPEDGEAARHRVRAGREALVGQRLPGGQDGDALGRQVAVQGERQVVRLATGRGDHHQGGAPVVGGIGVGGIGGGSIGGGRMGGGGEGGGEGGGQRRAGTGRNEHVELAARPSPREVDGLADGVVLK